MRVGDVGQLQVIRNLYTERQRRALQTTNIASHCQCQSVHGNGLSILVAGRAAAAVLDKVGDQPAHGPLDGQLASKVLNIR